MLYPKQVILLLNDSILHILHTLSNDVHRITFLQNIQVVLKYQTLGHKKSPTQNIELVVNTWGKIHHNLRLANPNGFKFET